MSSRLSSIAELVRLAVEVNGRIAAADVNGIWQYGGPNQGAEEVDIHELVTRYDVPSDYLDLLRVTIGWSGFYHDVDLLRVDELLGSDKLERAWMLTESADDGAGDRLGLDRASYLPVGVSNFDIDVFLLNMEAAIGQIRWMAGSEIERFDSIEHFVKEMTSYNRETLQDLLNDPGLGAM